MASKLGCSRPPTAARGRYSRSTLNKCTLNKCTLNKCTHPTVTLQGDGCERVARGPRPVSITKRYHGFPSLQCTPSPPPPPPSFLLAARSLRSARCRCITDAACCGGSRAVARRTAPPRQWTTRTAETYRRLPPGSHHPRPLLAARLPNARVAPSRERRSQPGPATQQVGRQWTAQTVRDGSGAMARRCIGRYRSLPRSHPRCRVALRHHGR